MSLWTKWQALPREALAQVQSLYGDHFPIEVRCALAEWIEERPWEELDPDNPQHEAYVSQLVPSLVAELQTRATNADENFLMRLKLNEAANYFHQSYSHNPFLLVRVIKQCIQGERRIIQQSENQISMPMDSQAQILMDPCQELNQRFEKVNRRTAEGEEELRKMQHDQEQFIIQYQESNKRATILAQLSAQPNGQQSNPELLTKMTKEKEHLDNALRQRASALIQMRGLWLEKHQDTFAAVSALQKTVLDEELIKWKRGQQLGGNGGVFENNLEKIQEWCENLAETIWQLRQQLRRVETFCTQLPLQNTYSDKITAMNQQMTALLSSLVTSTFIIEKQPPQVMKTNTRFTSTIRLLVGGKLNVHMTPPQVKVSIISEAQANSLLKNDQMMNEASGEILNNLGTMEYHSATRQLSVNFRNMQLRKIKRAEKKGTESVMDEKFSLLFQSKFKVGGGELVFQVWTLSLPVVVIVHGNQEPHAWATVTWDNAFAEPGRAPFVVPDKVPWMHVGEVLSMKFKSYVGRDLNKDALHFLGGKAFRNSALPDYDHHLLTWSQFCKEPLPNHSFTFWEWFYAILKVTREHLRGPWNDGTVIGFVGRKQAEDLLLQCLNGTFLLRYSDSELGGVTIAWVAEGQEGRPEVFMLQPFTSRDFGIRALADRINDLKHLLYLYPDTPKDQAYGKYYTQMNDNQPQPNGYVKPVLVVQIPGWSQNSLDSYPNTPQSVIHNPNSPSESISYHENPASVLSCGMDQMNSGSGDLQMEDIFNLDIDVSGLPEIDTVDLSSITMAELMGYDKSLIN